MQDCPAGRLRRAAPLGFFGRRGKCPGDDTHDTGFSLRAAVSGDERIDENAGVPGVRHRTEDVCGIRLHWAEVGEGPAVVLLHGFPDFWRGWRRQMPELAARGFRAVAADLRGYHLSGRPRGVAAYAMRHLVADVVGLIERLGERRVHLAGHDWGGVIAWYVAMHHPERVNRLVIANAPHPAAFRRELRRGGQLLRSWYAGFFQLPWLPEWALRRDHCAAVARIFRRSPERPGAFSDEDVAAYRASAAAPGALAAMLAYYRAALRHPTPPVRPVDAPTLLIWGERDRALSPRLTEGLERWVPDLRVARLPGAGHWVMADEPGRVSRLMTDFLEG